MKGSSEELRREGSSEGERERQQRGSVSPQDVNGAQAHTGDTGACPCPLKGTQPLRCTGPLCAC
jgi:hypothetical protein